MAFSAISSFSAETEPNDNNDAFTETIKMIEDDYHKFNEIMGKHLKTERDIEKQLEKEDKKCTFLKHTITGLKKKMEDKNRLRTEQRNYLFDLQMEIEQISSTIYEEMEIKRIAYPEEDAKPYREMANVVQRMIERISSFKTVVQECIDDSTNRTVEITYWKNCSEQLVNRISELKKSKDRLRSKVDEMTSYVNAQSLENINRSTENLQKIHKEFENTKMSHHEVVCEKNRSDLWKQQIIVESKEKKTSWLLIEEKYEQFEKSSADNMKILRTEISSTKQWYHDVMNEMKTNLEIIEKRLNEYDCLIQERLVVLEDINRQKITLESKDETIILSTKHLDDELSRLQELNETLKTQEEFAKDMYTSMQLHVNGLETSVLENEIYIKNLQEESTKLKDYLSSLMSCDESSDAFKSMKPTDLENLKKQNDKLEKEHNKLKQKERDLHIAKNELKFKMTACDAEIDFLNLLNNQINTSINEEKRKVNEKTNNKIEKCIENVTELSNIVFEKNLLLDTVRADVQKYFNSIPQLECEVKSQTKNIAEKKAKLSQIKEAFNEEEKNLQSKVKLLEDLEKNTFPKNKIPTEWVHSLQQQKNDCEKLKAERLELEEKRNDLRKTEKELAEKKNNSESLEIYTDTESKKPSLDLETKSAAYKLFKERILKKHGAPLLG